jgi:hypothetical protein
MADESKPFDPAAYLAKTTGAPPPTAAVTPGNRGARAPIVPPLEQPAPAPVYGGAAPAEPFAYTDQGIPIGSGTGAGAGGDPYGAFSTAGRVISGAATGIPDALTAIGNAAVRASGPGGSFGTMGVDSGVKLQEAPYLGQMLNRTMGVAELPKDASLARRLTEGGGSALLGGGVNSIMRNMSKASPEMVSQLWQAAKTLTTNVAAPTVASEAGGAGGEAIAKYLKLDPQTGALIGSLLGGSAAGAAPGAYDRYSHNWYADRAKPNAPEIDAAMTRMGGEATPGQLGNNAIQQLERTLGSSTGAKQYIDERRQSAYDTIGDALNRAADARGMTAESPTTTTAAVPTPGTIGDKIGAITRETAEGLRQGGEEAQARLMDRVGAMTPVPLRPLQDAGARLQLPGSGVEPGMKANIEHRLGPALEALLFRRDGPRTPATLFNPDTGLPTAQSPMIGHNGGPAMRGPYVDQGSVAAPYADVKGYRTELGRDLDLPGGQRLGPAAQLYGPVTDAMRAAAERRGVPRQDFENIQSRTQQTETTPTHKGDPTGDYNTMMDIAVKKPDEAFQFMKRGEQNAGDLGLLEATQHPAVPGLFGDYMKLIGRNTINDLDVSAAGARQTAGRLEDMHPESKATLFGDQAGPMQDVETGARAYNYPTSQTGLNRATGAAADRNAATTVVAQALEKMGGPAGLLTLGALPLINRMRAGGLNSPQTMEALRTGQRGPSPYTTGNMSDLVAALTAASAANDQRQLPRR